MTLTLEFAIGATIGLLIGPFVTLRWLVWLDTQPWFRRLRGLDAPAADTDCPLPRVDVTRSVGKDNPTA